MPSRSTNRTFEGEPLTVLDAPREYAEASLFIDDGEDMPHCPPDPEWMCTQSPISKPIVLLLDMDGLKLLFMPQVEVP